jgi:UDP-N-acetylglucosamine transferase subunit ALG13
MPHASLLTPSAFRQRVQWADVIVAHAGMGSLITAMQYGKPIVVMPRFGRLKETRNDHQVATAERFRTLPTVAVAMDASELAAALERTDLGSGGTRIGSAACSELIDAVRDVVIGTRASPPRR